MQQATGVALRLRGTFIDVDEAGDATRGCGRVRARSASAALAPCRDCTTPCSETEYIRGLSRKLASLWKDVDTSPAETTPGAHVVRSGFFAEDSSAPWAEAAPAVQPQIAPCAGPSAKGSSAMCGGREEALALKAPPTPEAADLKKRGTAESQEGINKGSIAHPHLCSRPCLFFASGQCANGTECDFCHLPHSKRAAHLDKMRKQILRDMPQVRANMLVLPLVWEKVLEISPSLGSKCAFDHLVRACGDVGRHLPTRMSGAERALVDTLRALGVRLLIGTAQRCVWQRSPAAAAAAEDVVAKLRGMATSP